MGLGPRTANDRVVALVHEHAASLLRIARAHSLCADDAQDAYQRALEIYLERADDVRPATAGAWLRTVCKHEAMRIRDQRRRSLGGADAGTVAEGTPDPGASPEERVASLERVARAAEALRGCKPDEVTAMLLKADGSSYAEIGELTGWSFTKVNRCLAEGRARFAARFAAIDSGAACEGWAPVLAAIADGLAGADDMASVRPHLRHCSACRATLRALYESERALGALVPAGALVVAGPEPAIGVVARAYEAVAAGLGERIARLHAAIELLTSSKAAAVVASTAAVAAGGAAVAEHAVPPMRPPSAARSPEAGAGHRRAAGARRAGAVAGRATAGRAAGAAARVLAAAPVGTGGRAATPTAGVAAGRSRRAPTSGTRGARAAAAKRAPRDAPQRRARDFTIESGFVPSSVRGKTVRPVVRRPAAAPAPAASAEPAGDYGSDAAPGAREFAFEE